MRTLKYLSRPFSPPEYNPQSPYLFSTAYLNQKYYRDFNFLQAKLVNQLLTNKVPKKISITLQDYVIYDFIQECCKDYYDNNAMGPVLSLFVEFYASYKGIFQVPNLSVIKMHYNIFKKWMLRRRKLNKDEMNAQDDYKFSLSNLKIITNSKNKNQILYSVDSDQEHTPALSNTIQLKSMLMKKPEEPSKLENEFSKETSYCSTVFNIYQNSENQQNKTAEQNIKKETNNNNKKNKFFKEENKNQEEDQ